MTVLRFALLASIVVAAGCTASGGDASGSPAPPGAGNPATSGAPAASVAPAATRVPAVSVGPAASQPVPMSSMGPGAGTSSPNIDLPSSVVDPVLAAIARVAGVPVAQVTVMSATPVTFPDAGLGCPEPGMAYAQVQVDGYRSSRWQAA